MTFWGETFLAAFPVEVSKHSWILWMMTCHSIWHTQKVPKGLQVQLPVSSFENEASSHFQVMKSWKPLFEEKDISRKTMRMWLWREMSKVTNLQIVRIGIITFQTYKLLEVGTIVTCKLFLQCLHFLFEQEPISRKTLQARVPCAYRAPIGWVGDSRISWAKSQRNKQHCSETLTLSPMEAQKQTATTTRKRVIGDLISHLYSCLNLHYRYIIIINYLYMCRCSLINNYIYV